MTYTECEIFIPYLVSSTPSHCQQENLTYDILCVNRGTEMGLAASERDLADRTARYLKAELKRAGVTYAELAKRLEAHGLKETEASIANKLSRGTIAATFLVATLASLGIEGIRLEDI